MALLDRHVLEQAIADSGRPQNPGYAGRDVDPTAAPRVHTDGTVADLEDLQAIENGTPIEEAA